MLYILMVFLSVSVFLEAAQKSRYTTKFDISKLHPEIQKCLKDDSSDDEFTVEDYQECCAQTKVLYLADAVDKNDHAKIKELVKQDVDVNADITSDKDMRSGCLDKVALHVAAVRGYVQSVEELLKAKNININAAGAFHDTSRSVSYVRMTPLMLALACGKVVVPRAIGLIIDYERIVRLLIKHGADVTAVTQENNTCQDALLFALQYGTADMIKTLLKNGANVHATYQQGYWNYQSVLKNAIDRKDLKIVKMLLDAGADVEEEIIIRLELDQAIITKPLCYCLMRRIEPGSGRLTLLEEFLLRGASMDANYNGTSFEDMLRREYGDEPIKKLLGRIDTRNKETAEQAKQILAPELLLLDLAKIVSEYIAAPITLSKDDHA